MNFRSPFAHLQPRKDATTPSGATTMPVELFSVIAEQADLETLRTLRRSFRAGRDAVDAARPDIFAQHAIEEYFDMWSEQRMGFDWDPSLPSDRAAPPPAMGFDKSRRALADARSVAIDANFLRKKEVARWRAYTIGDVNGALRLMPRLRRLALDVYSIQVDPTNERLDLGLVPRLESLTIYTTRWARRLGFEMGMKNLANLTALTSLKELNFRQHIPFTDSDLKIIGSFRGLERLSLTLSDRRGNHLDFSSLDLPKLKHLELDGNASVEHVIAMMKRSQSLETIEFHSASIDQPWFESFHRNVPGGLKRIVFENCVLSKENRIFHRNHFNEHLDLLPRVEFVLENCRHFVFRNNHSLVRPPLPGSSR